MFSVIKNQILFKLNEFKWPHVGMGYSTGQHRSQVLSASTNLYWSVKSKRCTSTLAISQADESGLMVIKSKRGLS